MFQGYYKLTVNDRIFYVKGFDEVGGLLDIEPENTDETSNNILFQMFSVLHKKWMKENYRYKSISGPGLILSKEFTYEVGWLVKQFEGMTAEYIGPIIEGEA